jgi:hypothetical protein
MSAPDRPSLAARLVYSSFALLALFGVALFIWWAAFVALVVGVPPWIVGAAVLTVLAATGVAIQRVRRSASRAAVARGAVLEAQPRGEWAPPAFDGLDHSQRDAGR